MNCHGCVHLLPDLNAPVGQGYCIRVVRSASYQSAHIENGKQIRSSCVRTANMERCELFLEVPVDV